MKLITDAQHHQLVANGTTAANGVDHDPFPVVKLFTPDANATWLLTELDPLDSDVAFGLCERVPHATGWACLGGCALAKIRDATVATPIRFGSTKTCRVTADRRRKRIRSALRSLGHCRPQDTPS